MSNGRAPTDPLASHGASKSRADAWSPLWKTGVLHSCNQAFSGNYAGSLREFWQGQFARLEQGARLVDIGTGNGAIPLLASEYARQQAIGLELHGVDLADIAPPAAPGALAAAYAGITFHPRTSALSLPFPDGTIDLLTSQYAFEYMPRADAVAEVIRVIGTKGSAAFVLHSHDSVISRVLTAQRRGFAWLFGPSQILLRAREAIHAQMKSPAASSGTAIDPARARFREAAAELGALIDAEPDADILRKAAEYLRNALETGARSPEAALTILDRAAQACHDEYERLLQLKEAMLSREDLEALIELFNSKGYCARATPIDHAPGVRMGVAMTVQHV